jgi:transformation/transcription domain-associated protein
MQFLPPGFGPDKIQHNALRSYGCLVYHLVGYWMFVLCRPLYVTDVFCSPLASGVIADLVHHPSLRTHLSADQLVRVSKFCSALIHNPSLVSMFHTQVMFGLIENITAKDTPQGAACILSAMFETCVDRVDAMADVLHDAFERLEKAKTGDESLSPSLQIERARPVAAAVHAVEKPEEVIHGE